MYAPLLRREEFLVLLDPRHRVALLRTPPTGCDGPLALPSVRRRERETYAEAARRITVGSLRPTDLRPGELVGRVQPLPPVPAAPAARREARIFFAHLDSEGQDRPGPAGSGISWVPHTSVAEAVAAQHIPELGAFIEGYVDGWIPDGWITLGP